MARSTGSATKVAWEVGGFVEWGSELVSKSVRQWVSGKMSKWVDQRTIGDVVVGTVVGVAAVAAAAVVLVLVLGVNRTETAMSRISAWRHALMTETTA